MGSSASPFAATLDGVPTELVPSDGSEPRVAERPYEEKPRLVVLNQDAT